MIQQFSKRAAVLLASFFNSHLAKLPNASSEEMEAYLQAQFENALYHKFARRDELLKKLNEIEAQRLLQDAGYQGVEQPDESENQILAELALLQQTLRQCKDFQSNLAELVRIIDVNRIIEFAKAWLQYFLTDKNIPSDKRHHLQKAALDKLEKKMNNTVTLRFKSLVDEIAQEESLLKADREKQLLNSLTNFAAHKNTSRLDILDLFDELKDRQGFFNFIHQQENYYFDRFRLFLNVPQMVKQISGIPPLIKRRSKF
jgi:hypothetical protein